LARRTSYEGRVAVVTGGGSGIGRALGSALAGRGAVVVLADIDGPAAERAASAIRSAADGPVSARPLDVRDTEAFERLIDETVERHGRIDLLCNNAGVSLGGPTHELTAAHWDLVIDVNLRGVVNGILAAYPRMVAQGCGQIVNTASGAGLVAPPFVTPYATTKHAVVGLSTGLRPEAALHGVRVSVLCPGAVETPILDRAPPEGLPPTRSAPVTARQYLAVVGQRPMAAEVFAERALDQISRDKAIVTVPRAAASLWYLHRLSPALVDRLNRSVARRVERRLVRPAR
jgi:NAD(P)-dependent dehydrogenase (short-subunit alcohol dehydrogenase family)